MKCMITTLFALLAVLLLCGCGGAPQLPVGIVTEVSEAGVTFDEVLWISGDDLPKDHAGDYELRPTGQTVTLTVNENSKFWILWHVHWMQPARISTADFVRYFNMSSKLVFNFYSTEGRLIMASEQYTA